MHQFCYPPTEGAWWRLQRIGLYFSGSALLLKPTAEPFDSLYEEHRYLQEVIARQFRQHFEVATLVRANSNDDRDLQLFLESDVGIFLLEEERVAEARQAVDRLKGEIET